MRMLIKDIVDENFQDYKDPTMLIAMCNCDWKCLKEIGADIHICQNSKIAEQEPIEISYEEIYNRYANNPITEAIVFGGLEPMLQFEEVLGFIRYFRSKSYDKIIIYTGYYPNEIRDEIVRLFPFGNIIIKFGRFQPSGKQVFDPILGVTLSSNNQFAMEIG